MTYEEIIGKVSKELNLPDEVVDKTYKSFWICIRQNIQALPLKNINSEEDFNTLRTNFNIPSLGKLNCTYSKMVGVKNKFKYIKQLKKREDD